MDGLAVPVHGFRILTGNANRPLAESIAKSLDVDLCKATVSRFADGEVFVRLDENVRGADRILGLDFHFHQLQGFFDIPVDHLYAAPVFTAHYRKKGLVDPVVVAPDVGSAKMARGFAKRLTASLAIIDKRRPTANVAEVVNVVGEVEGKDCLLADDMIDTAGTVSEAAKALKDLGARNIYVCATHALLSGPAVDRLSKAPITEVAITDSILLPESKRFDKLTVLSVGELMAKAIRFTHSDQSVSSLFE